MKYSLILFFLFLFVSPSNGQVTIGSNTYANAGFLNGAYHFSYDSNPSGPGGVNTVIRNGNRWFLVSLVTWPSYGWRIIAYTVNEHCSLYPPANVMWNTFYATGPGPAGYSWGTYPSGTPSLPSGTVQSIVITGEVINSYHSTTLIQPDYIDLPIKSTLPTPNTGRLVYDVCSNTMAVNNGFSWSQLWPLKTNYKLENEQGFEFSDPSLKIISTNTAPPSSSPSQVLRFQSGGSDNLVIGSSNFITSYNSGVNLTSSVGGKTSFAGPSYSVSNNDYIVYNSMAGNDVTLPSANTVNGRILILVNTHTSSLLINNTVNGLTTSSINGKSAIKVVAVGGEWYKID